MASGCRTTTARAEAVAAPPWHRAAHRGLRGRAPTPCAAAQLPELPPHAGAVTAASQRPPRHPMQIRSWDDRIWPRGRLIFHSAPPLSLELLAAPRRSSAPEPTQNFEEGPAAAIPGAGAGSRLAPPAAAGREGGEGRRWCGELGRRPRRGRPERFADAFPSPPCV
jgi:hypothetical protein